MKRLLSLTKRKNILGLGERTTGAILERRNSFQVLIKQQLKYRGGGGGGGGAAAAAAASSLLILLTTSTVATFGLVGLQRFQQDENFAHNQQQQDNEEKKVQNAEENGPVIFAGSSGKALAASIAKNLGTKVADADLKRFADGEVNIKIKHNVRGKDVFVVQSTCPNVDENLMELLLMVSALQNASAKRVTVVIPYFGYMRSPSGNAPIGAWSLGIKGSHRSSAFASADIARMFEVMGTYRVVTFDIQNPGQGMAEGFFRNTIIESLYSNAAIVSQVVHALGLKDLEKEELTVVSPNSRAMTKAKLFQAHLERELGRKVGLSALIRTPPIRVMTGDMASSTAEEVDELADHGADANFQPGALGGRYDLVGDVAGKNVLIVDDVIDSGRSIVEAAELLKQNGANHVYAFASHAILTGTAKARIDGCKGLEKIVCLDTVPSRPETNIEKLSYVSIAQTLSDLIQILHDES